MLVVANPHKALAWAAALLVVSQLAPSVSAQRRQDAGQQVELFSAVDAGLIEVNVYPKDATRATVVVKNHTEKPLRIAMPEAFVGVPVLAQFGGGGGGLGGGGLGGGGLGGGGLGGGGGGNQSFGGGFGGGGGGLGGGGGFGGGGGGLGGGGFFNVAPEAVGKIKVTTVCLEHGKDDPQPRIPYALKPISKFTSDEQVIEICKMLGRGEIPQSVAQAAAWHVTDGLNWQQLASKVKVEHLDGSVEMYFNHRQLALAARVTQEAARRAATQPAQGAPEEDYSVHPTHQP